MRKNLFPLVGLILIACGQPAADHSKTAKEEAIILQDSALKVLRQGPDNHAVDKSLALLDKAIEKNPHLKSAYFHKMNIYKKKGDTEGMFKTLVEENDNNPKDAYSTLSVGLEYEVRGDTEKADKKYNEAVRLFEATLDTLPAKNGLIRNTYILNLAMAKTLANQNFDISEVSGEMDEAEIENLKIALTTLKSMNRDDLLNLRKKKRSNQ